MTFSGAALLACLALASALFLDLAGLPGWLAVVIVALVAGASAIAWTRARR